MVCETLKWLILIYTCVVQYSQLQKIAKAYRKKHIIEKLAALTCRSAKIPPRNFVKCDAFSAVAIAMTVPVNIVTRSAHFLVVHTLYCNF